MSVAVILPEGIITFVYEEYEDGSSSQCAAFNSEAAANDYIQVVESRRPGCKLYTMDWYVHMDLSKFTEEDSEIMFEDEISS